MIIASLAPSIHSKVRTIAIISFATVFFGAGVSKLVGTTFSIDSFARWGLPDGARQAVGTFEAALAMTLLAPATRSLGALGLAVIALGATITHLRTPGEAGLALVPFALFLGLVLLAAAELRRHGATMLRETSPSVGPRLLASSVAVLAIVAPAAADYNSTHIFNPLWTPHAKFHGAHTIFLGAALGLCSLYLIWTKRAFLLGLTVGALFWTTQALAATLPGTAFVDPEHAHTLPRIAGVPLTQIVIDGLLLATTWTAGAWAWRRSASA
jgi:hypothetical protein